MIKADDAANAVLQDQALNHQLTVFGDAFRIGGDNLNAMIRASYFYAAVGVDIGLGLFESPFHTDAAGHRARRR